MAKLITDVGQVKSAVTSSMSSIESSVRSAKGALEALGIGLSVGALALFASNTFAAITAMKTLGQEAGTTAAAISRFEQPARSAGLGLDAVAASMFRMSKAALESQDPASKSALALNAIGISTAQLKSLKPDEMFELVARRLATYGDGLTKNSVVQQLFGKSGREMNEVIAEIGETSKLTATVTNDEAEAAKHLSDQLLSLKMNGEALWRSLVSDAVPALSAITQAFMDGKREAGLFAGVVAAVSASFDAINGDAMTAKLKQVNDAIKSAQTSADSLAANGTTFLGIERTGDIQNAAKLNDLLKQRSQIESTIFQAELEAQNRRAAAGQLAANKPQIHYTGGAGSAAVAADQSASNALVANLEKEAVKTSELWANDLKLQAVMIDIAKLKKDGKPVDEARIIALAKEIDANTAYNKTAVEMAAGDAAVVAGHAAMVLAANNALAAIAATNKEMTFENSLLGMSADARELATLARQKELAVDKATSDVLKTLTAQQYDEVAALIAARQAAQSQLSVWNDLSDRVANFFSGMVSGGKSAIQALRDMLKSFVAEMVALFAKRWILQLGATAVGATSLAGNALAGQAANTGAGTLGGAGNNLLSTGMSAAGGYLFGGTSAVTSAGYISGFESTAGAIGTGGFAATIGTGATSLAGAFGASAGAATAFGTAVATAIPIIGWVVGIGLVLYSLFGQKGGGPKGGGSFNAAFNSVGASLGGLPVSGTDNGRFFTPSNSDPQLAIAGNTLAAGFFSTLKALGGSVSGNVGFGLGFDTDPNGKANNRISSGVTVNGQSVFSDTNRDVGRDSAQLQTELQLEASRDILAALQASTLPDYLSKVFDGLTASTATQQQITDAFSTAAALKSIFDVVSRNPMEDLATAVANSADQFTAALHSNAAAIQFVMSAYNGSLVTTQNLATATTTYYNAQMQLLAGITQASIAIDQMFGATFQNIHLAGLDTQGKYNFYQADAASAQASVLTSSDPATIQALATRINNDINSAFGLLSPDEQAARGGQFIAQGTTAQHQLDDRLQQIQKATADQTQKMLDSLRDLIGASSKATTDAAKDVKEGGAEILTAAHLRQTLIVMLPNGSQQVVGFGG